MSIIPLIPAAKRRSWRSLAALALAMALATGPAAALSERWAHDDYTGLAIGGHDPVAYFVEGRALAGKPEHELAWGGGYWRFVNPGNAAAFEAAPEVYAPAYGGYGVTGVARGVAQPADPRLFAVYRDRLFLFHDAADLRAFRADPDPIIAAADAAWPAIAAVLPD